MRKRQATLSLIQALCEKGIKLSAISNYLPPSRLRVISVQLEETTVIEETLSAQGVNEPERYFTETPFSEDGKTYVLTKMWGRGTVPALSALRDAFTESGVSFQERNEPHFAA